MKKLLGILGTLTATPVRANTLSTNVDIDAAATKAHPGDTIQLYIDETNDGDLRLEQVKVDLYENGTLIATLTLGDAYWVGGDTGGDVSNVPGHLDAGETWSWMVERTVTTDTTFCVIGYGVSSPSQFPHDVVTYPDYPEERACIDITVGEGITPGFWKNHLDAWVGYSPSDDFDSVFGVDFFNPDITLAEALNLNGAKINALARHAAAALLNTAHPNIDYPMTEAEIISAVQSVDTSDKDAVEALKDMFDEYNNLEGDIDS
jgi:hypothetical protein